MALRAQPQRADLVRSQSLERLRRAADEIEAQQLLLRRGQRMSLVNVEVDLGRREDLAARPLDRLRLALDDDVQLSTQAIVVASDAAPNQRSRLHRILVRY